jgi:hypothetical protein
VRTVLAESPAGAAVAFLGDDLTDEDAFRALSGRGLSVLVRARPRSTAADVRLAPPAELLAFLDAWSAHATAGAAGDDGTGIAARSRAAHHGLGAGSGRGLADASRPTREDER